MGVVHGDLYGRGTKRVLGRVSYIAWEIVIYRGLISMNHSFDCIGTFFKLNITSC